MGAKVCGPWRVISHANFTSDANRLINNREMSGPADLSLAWRMGRDRRETISPDHIPPNFDVRLAAVKAERNHVSNVAAACELVLYPLDRTR